ncbi:YciI family protein [Micromonospora sp. NBC_01796]|uniref:YciI family protein n=1 Tax=Micromonospora sp. NBC_01796 TaxID=2975987 RepID=UPI002DD98431|nr:YciI family protein [Micromonospora sp. NBC_01796]WSA85281.1 YciI family protein [Micromonospora sp. NBC_01796]
MLHLLYLRYTGSEQEAEPFVPGHVLFLERYHHEGTFLVSGQALPSMEGGAIVACAADRAAIERVVAEDPFVKAGVATYAVTTIDPGRVHPALAGMLGVDASRVRG